MSYFRREDRLQRWERKMRFLNLKTAQKLASYVPKGGVFIDVGANVGVFSDGIINARRDCQCYLFEPIPEYYDYCVKKYKDNKRVIVENYALGDVCEESKIYMDKKNLGWNTVIESMTNPLMAKIQIKMIKFDDYVDEIGLNNIDLLKIDVEGAEYRVLSGMKKTLSGLDKKPIIFCEIGWGSKMHPYWHEECEVFEWLFQNGYKRFDYNAIEATQDVLIIPESRA
jgi:FkbM family methyltransferase